MDFIDAIPLELDRIKEAHSYSFSKNVDHTGQTWADRTIRVQKARKYLEEHLVANPHGAKQIGRCCNSGYITFQRKDLHPITDDDVTAIMAISRGQENRVEERSEGLVTIYWLCDSGD